jgi:hypothetical protein
VPGPRKCRLCHQKRQLANTRSRVCYTCFPRWLAKSTQEKAERQLRADAYMGLVMEHDEKCMICGYEPKKRKLNVDHNHKTGQLRGLLCYRCNYGLHWFRDNPELLKAASVYLEQFPTVELESPEPQHEPWCSSRRGSPNCNCEYQYS